MKNSLKFFFALIFTASLDLLATNTLSTVNNSPDYLRGCINPHYSKSGNDVKLGSLNANKMNIKSSGEIELDGKVYIPMTNGSINASSAIYQANQEKIKELKDGNIFYLDNYFQFANGSVEKNSGKLELLNGSTYLKERNLLVNYQSLNGVLGSNTKFKNASITSCINPSDGWR